MCVNDAAFGFDELTEPYGSEEDVEEAVIDLLEADGQLGEEMADVDPVVHPSDPTVGADTSDHEVLRIRDRGEGLGEGTRGRSIEVGRDQTAEGFMRSDRIVLGAEGIERALLSPEVGPRLTSCTALEVDMHVLVRTVLVGTRGFNEFRPYTELDEPDGEGAESAERVGSEGCPVVGPDPKWEPIRLKEPLQCLLCGHRLGAREAFATEQHA